MIRRRLIIGLLTLHFCGLSNAVEILRWDRIPLALPLIIGQERIVFVDQNVRVGLPRNLVDKLRVQSTGGALYLLAKEPIEPTRLQLQNMNSGEIMLVDIIATVGKPNQAAPEPVKIVAGENPATRYGQVSSKPTGSRAAAPTVQTSVQSADEDPPKPRRETPLPVVMTRYAAQMLYAPLRTVEPVDGIAQVNLKRGLDLTTLLPTLPVGSSALGSWRLDEYWVTAVKLRKNPALLKIFQAPRTVGPTPIPSFSFKKKKKSHSFSDTLIHTFSHDI
ncbi:TIGR03749 family integrating conjugative element protein [Pseudomonas sp. PA-3-6E]|nr:TIGR03749 family integrating conjugative element protein [Pseudomonas sp. PA-3-6E]MCF5517523.1 TIGR03749 family integrating conjugative element protein [Pseudomonas sp. PA-3-6E]